MCEYGITDFQDIIERSKKWNQKSKLSILSHKLNCCLQTKFSVQAENALNTYAYYITDVKSPLLDIITVRR